MNSSRENPPPHANANRYVVGSCWTAAVLLAGLGLASIMSGCGGNRELPSDWGSLEVEQDTPQNFELAWRVFEQILTFNLTRQDDPNETSTGLVDDPKALNENAQPKELVIKPSITLPQARIRVVECLNNWINGSDVQEETEAVWQRDALIDKLPAYLQASQMLDLGRLDDLRYRDEDFEYLQQCLWMREISRWASDTDCGPLASSMIQRIESTHDAEESRQLAAAVKLFDWTVRNIQLDPLPPQPQDITAGPGGDERPRPAAEAGIPGPGYSYHPWQVVLFGHGDAWQRARVFIQLGRQAGIDVVMLAAEDTGPAQKHRPLLTAARIGDKLYLFDPQLGLPIPGPSDQPIATLGDVLDEPQLLRQLDVDEGGEKLSYPIKAEDLQSIVALIDADSPALSWRMQIAEQHLSGHRKAVLTTSPVAVASRVQKCRGVKVARLWRVPFETQIYRTVLPMVAQQRPDVAGNLMYEQQVFLNVYSPQCMGRFSHLWGRFWQQGDTPPASKWYLDARAPKDIIESLEVSARVQRQSESEEQEAMRKQNAEQMAVRLQLAKWQSTVWLAQTKYETGDFGTALNWLEKVDMTEDNPWKSLATYNLARTHEALDDVDGARRIYLVDESPQQHGNRIRAKLLRELQLK
ncbi:MAG: hypothetical protein RIC55_30470 [Pirellulaceae bacterium]